MRRRGVDLVFSIVLLALPTTLLGAAASGFQSEPLSVPPSAVQVKAIGAPLEKASVIGVAVAAATAPNVAASDEAGPLQVNAALPAPTGFIQASHCVAREGIHYIREKAKALSPILVYDEAGKLISLEYIIAQKTLQAGKSLMDLPGVAGRSIDHINFDFTPASRQGNPTPYYSVHLYFIDRKEQQQICPNSKAVEPVGRAVLNQ